MAFAPHLVSVILDRPKEGLSGRAFLAMAEYAFDFLISRRGGVGAIAAEVAGVLEAEGYRIVVQDYDFKHGGDFIADIHEALIAARNLFILHTADYDQNIWTRKEFTSFLALVAASTGERRICILRCDESVPRGILANTVFGDIAGVADREERRRIILAVARGESLRQRREPIVFGGDMPKRNANFTGRQSSIAAIEKLLASPPDSQTMAVAVCGLGGIGKTSLVRACVDKFAPDYAGVWWAHGQTRQALVSALAALALRCDPKFKDEADLEKLARAALSRVEAWERPFLLVFDNVETPQLADEFMPARGAHVLITSRWSDWGGRAREFVVDTMSEDEATAFLQARAGRHDEAGARQLVKALGCLPLALDHAGAYVRLTMSSFNSYCRNLDKLLGKTPKDAPYPASVAATFSMAMDSAVRECPAAEFLLAHLAFFAPERIPLYLLPPPLLAEEDRAEALAALIGVSLMRADPLSDDEPGISLHRLVQAAARMRLAAQGKTAAVLGTAAKIAASSFPDDGYDEPKTWPRCAELLAHGLALREHAQSLGAIATELAVLCHRMGKYLHGRALFASAEELLRDAVWRAETAHGSSSLELAHAMNDLGNLLDATARSRDAEPLLRKALLLQEERLGRDDPGCARTMTNLAWVLHSMQKMEEAEQLLREAIASGERKLGRSHPDVAVRMNNLALILKSLGRIDEAEFLLREAVAAGELSHGREHPLVLARLNNLASLLQVQGKVAEAEKLFREAIEVGAQALGREHPDLAVRLNNLANLLRDAERFGEAEPLYRDAIAIAESKLGERHPMNARIKRNLATLLLAAGKPEEALRIAEGALSVHEEILGREHRWTLDSAATCADALMKLDRRGEAETLRQAYRGIKCADQET